VGDRSRGSPPRSASAKGGTKTASALGKTTVAAHPFTANSSPNTALFQETACFHGRRRLFAGGFVAL